MMATMSNILPPSPPPPEQKHQRTSSRDNSYNNNDEDCFQEPHDSNQTFIVEHIDEKNFMDVSLLESELHEPIKNCDISIEKENNGLSEETDCTTVTLSTSTSDRSGSSWGKTRLASNPWAARFVRTTNAQETTLPLPLAVDQTHTVSPLSTPSPTGQRSRKVFGEQVLETPHPPLKHFGAQSDAPQVAALQIQSLEAIMAKKKNDGRLGHWWRKEQQQQQEMEQLEEEEASVAAESTTSSMKSIGDKTVSFRWGRFLIRSSSSSTMTLKEDETTVTGDGEDSHAANEMHERKSWKNRFSFRPSLLDTMLDDISNPYFDSVSLSSECSSSFGGSTSSVSGIKSNENDSTSITSTDNSDGKSHRRRWSRLWRAQEFSQEVPTVHMI